jgi:hypothetical protein
MSNYQNPIVIGDASYVGLYYAFSATGGYEAEQGAKTITMIPVNQINQYDVTESIQVIYDVRAFNEKIGLFKDASNINIISSAYDISTNSFPTDSFPLTSAEFAAGVTETSQVISVGKYNTLYSNFISYVNNYFGYPEGFSTIFNLSSQVDINAGVFDAGAFINLIHGNTPNPVTGEYIKDLSGSITMSYINQILNYIVFSNPFNNRPASGNGGVGYSLKDGFIEGDIIFVPNGLSTTLNMDIVNNNIQLNYLGAAHLANLNSQTNYVNGYFSSITTTVNNNIKQVVKAPLLIKLANLS